MRFAYIIRNSNCEENYLAETKKKVLLQKQEVHGFMRFLRRLVTLADLLISYCFFFKILTALLILFFNTHTPQFWHC